MRSRYDDTWAAGFEVVAVEATGFRLRRLSDGRELPVLFPTDQVRPARS